MADQPAQASGGRAPSGAGTVLVRLAGFVVLPLLALVMPLLLLPILRDLVPDEGWSSVMSGQSIGTIAAVVILWGWNVDGTVQIARATSQEARAEVYARSVRTRLLLSLVVVPVAAVATWLVARQPYADLELPMMLGYAWSGLSPAWYGIGAGRPVLLGLYDTVPRFLAVLASAPLLLLTRSLWPFAILTGLALVVSLVVFHRRHASGHSWWPGDVRATLRELGDQRHTAAINLAGQVYAQTPSPIATATASTPALALASGRLASTDTLYRLGLFSAVALGNAFQAWTLEPGVPDRRRRHLAAIVAHVALGVAGVIVLVLLGPVVSPIVAPHGAAATASFCLAYGLAFAFLSAGTPLIRNLLIPAGRQALVLRITMVAAVVGVVAMVAASLSGWTLGVAYGMAASELVMLVLLIPPSLRVLRAGE